MGFTLVKILAQIQRMHSVNDDDDYINSVSSVTLISNEEANIYNEGKDSFNKWCWEN